MLEQAEHEWLACPHALAAIRLLVLTGCRSAEVLKPSWDDVHLERRCLRLPASKARRRTVLLNEPALEVLCGIEQKDDNPHTTTQRYALLADDAVRRATDAIGATLAGALSPGAAAMGCPAGCQVSRLGSWRRQTRSQQATTFAAARPKRSASSCSRSRKS